MGVALPFRRRYAGMLSWENNLVSSLTIQIDGCPPTLALTEADIQPQLTVTDLGQSAIMTPRNEKDKGILLPHIWS